MSRDLSECVRQFAGCRVLLVGDLILDRYIYGDAERISPEAPVPVLRTVETREAVGGSANVAACLVALGCKVMCCGTIGADRHGKTLRGLLGELAIDTSAILDLEDRPTTTKTRLVGLAQHRHRQQLLRVDEEDTSPLQPADARRIAATATAAIPDADAICIEDYDKSVVSAELVATIIEIARQQGKPVLVDPARLNDFGRYRGADVITPNRAELALCAGRNLDTLDEVAKAATELCEGLEINAVVATLDRDGAVLVRKDEDWLHVRTVPRAVYDNTGAGDAVMAMLAAAVATGVDLESGVRLANVAGGLEVEKFGCVPISTDEILAELRLERLSSNGKLRGVSELIVELGLRRDRGETIAFTNGCFDILHAGHVEYLRGCREQGGVLVVGLNSDASVRAQGKGDDRPINTFENRAIVLSGLECVDYVVGFDEPEPESLIRVLRPDVLVKGEDWADKGVVGREFVESIGGRVELIPLMEGLSTSGLIAQIRGGNVPC